jgi:uncharacterized membrane protein HdeD (DUF308 family)
MSGTRFAGAMSFTLILALFFIVGGLFRAIGAELVQFQRWGLAALFGVVSIGLGIMSLTQMPASSVGFIGFAVGVYTIADGASLIVSPRRYTACRYFRSTEPRKVAKR